MALFLREDLECDTACSLSQQYRNVKSVYTTDSEKVESVIDSCGDCLKEQNFGICTYYSYSKQMLDFDTDGDKRYKLIEHVEYPYEERDIEEIIMHDIMYKLSVLGRCNGIYYSYETDRAEIPLNVLLEWNSDGPVVSEGEMRYTSYTIYC